MAKKLSKAAPYLVQQDGYPIKNNAQWLRNTFKPLMAKRLPSVLYGGFKYGYIVNFIQKHKKEYPYFIKVDIEKFYPGLSHHHLTVEAQMAYKMLLGLPYVPKSFKKHFLPASQAFFRSLPIANQGIPLNSAFSKAIAPLVYVSFFLSLKKLDYVEFIIYADDILMLCKNKRQGRQLYIELFNFLQSVQLQPNLSKVQQGRFSDTSLSFCGYQFAGGYVGIDEQKIKAFKEKISLFCTGKQSVAALRSPRVFIKRLNQIISGFGHYYKCANVSNVFEKLDGYIRNNIRLWFKHTGRTKPANKHLETLGLLSLSGLLKNKKQGLISPKCYGQSLEEGIKNKKDCKSTDDVLFAYLEKLTNQNVEIITQLKILVHAVKC